MHCLHSHLQRLFMVRRCIPAFVFLLLLLPVVAVAQTGTVTYARTLNFDTLNFHVDLAGQLEQFKEFMPPSVTTNYAMAFSGEQALSRFLDMEKLDLPQPKQIAISSSELGVALAHVPAAGADDIVVKVAWSGAGVMGKDTHWFVDYAEGVYVDRRELLNRKFLVRGTLPEFEWKLTGEEGQFLDRRVMKATAVMNSTSIEAWFTPEIPVALGPNHYSGLPGLILTLSVNGGEEVYEATEIALDVSEIDVSLSEDGRKVTEEEYQELVAEKRKELRQNRPSRIQISPR